MKKNILFFHQSADLYGSDKTLLFLTSEINKNLFTPVVVIPSKGPLYYELKKKNIKVIITPVLNIYRKMFNIKNLLSLPWQFFKSVKTLNQELKNIKIHLIHSNTAVVMLGFVYAKIKGIKHIWHIHEIIDSKKIIVKLYSRLLYFFSDVIVFNSYATQKSFTKHKKKILRKSIVIYNGISRKKSFLTNKEKSALKKSFNFSEDNLLIGLVGRISKHKGHFLLLDSFKKIINKHPELKLLFIGSTAKGKESVLESLKEKIREENLNNNVIIIPFQKDIWDIWDILDIAVVPTIFPEPFGLVALEAMLAKKPVIASNLGGLKEIVKNNKTGILFTNKKELINALKLLIEKKDLRKSYGKYGYDIAVKNFTLKKYINSFEKVYSSIF